MDLKNIEVVRHGCLATFNGSWHRGEHTNFIPSRANLAEPDALEKYVSFGWTPHEPFIDKSTKITAFGS